MIGCETTSLIMALHVHFSFGDNGYLGGFFWSTLWRNTATKPSLLIESSLQSAIMTSIPLQVAQAELDTLETTGLWASVMRHLASMSPFFPGSQRR